MQNLEVKNAVLKPEIKKILEDSIVNNNKNKNTDTEQKIVQKAKKMLQKLFTCHQTKIRSCKCYLMNASVS